MLNKSIFKSYDIRGIYPNELNDKTAFKIGRAFVKYTNVKKVVVGQDARISSPVLLKALTEGVVSQGADLYNIGQVPTELVYFAVAQGDFSAQGGYASGVDAGIMITASHNPKEYNGFKMLKKTNGGIEMIRGKDLFSAISQVDFKENRSGEIKEKDIFEDYKKYIFSLFNLGKIRPFKIVVDASNGVVGNVISKIKNKLPMEIIDLNFKPDGNFPNHSPNPLAEGSANQIKNEIIINKADFGFMFDGDADRIFLVDEEGKLMSADITLLLLAKYFLNKIPGSAIAYNAICSKAVPEFIKKWGGAPVRTAVGFINVREGLMKNNGVMGGELSGHYCFKDYFYMDSGMIAFLILLQILSADGRKVSEMVKELSLYFKSAELNFEVENKEAMLEKIKEKYSGGKQDYLDGVTVEYKNWWFNIRPSNTEPLLRLTIEGDTEDLLEFKKQELNNFICNKGRA